MAYIQAASWKAARKIATARIKKYNRLSKGYAPARTISRVAKVREGTYWISTRDSRR